MLTRLIFTFTLLAAPFFGGELANVSSYSRLNLGPDDKMLFILHAQDGHLEKAQRKNQYLLTLYKVTQSVTFFTDRPARKAGTVTVEEFLDLFQKEKPNAGLVSSISSKHKMSKPRFSDIPVTLSNPVYDSAHDRIKMDIQVLGNRQNVQTGDLGPTTLFIDDFGPYPGG